MVPALIAKIGIPALIGVLSQVLGGMENKTAKEASKVLSDLGDAVTGGQISAEQIAEANRHAEAVLKLQMDQDSQILSEVNQSLRTEAASDDKYVRRMRPTFGYLMAATWAAQMFAVAYIMVFRTAQAPVVLQAIDSLSMIWTVGLSVLGIYVYRRSSEKRAG